jgi:hypothetical protein
MRIIDWLRGEDDAEDDEQPEDDSPEGEELPGDEDDPTVYPLW